MYTFTDRDTSKSVYIGSFYVLLGNDINILNAVYSDKSYILTVTSRTFGLTIYRIFCSKPLCK